jgi:hypothetical protein
MSFSNLNIAPVVSPDILKNISASTAIKSFGNQLKDKAKETLISGKQSIISNLENQQKALTLQLETLAEKQTVELSNLQKQYESKQITEEEYKKREKSINDSIKAEEEIIKNQIKKLGEDITNIINNPYDRLKKEKAKLDDNIKNLKKTIEGTKVKAKKDLIKQLAKNTAKTLAPIIALQLANSFAVLISQRKKLEELVEQINLYIDTQVKDESTLTIATNLRNNAVILINSNISKLESIKKIIDRINTVLIILNAVRLALEIIIPLLPASFTPPFVVIRIVAVIERASDLTASLSVVLAVASTLLDNEINNLIELRNSLKEASLKLDQKALNDLTDDQFAALSDAFLPAGGNYGDYKGFKFEIKEEQNPRFVVKGNKRKYAVAIDRYGIEAIKSEYSFTQDPNDLIEQLKLIIDQQNLQG